MLSNSEQVFLIPENDIKPLQTIGAGLKKLVVVVDAETFGDNGKTTLDNMMLAIKYNPESDLIKVIIPAESNFTISSIMPDYRDLIIFGFSPEKLGFNVDYKMYEILHFDKTRMLICDKISEIIAFPEKKKILWQQLQTMFLK